jgi:hypothetical protein
MKNYWVPIGSFALAVALSILTTAPRAIAHRAPQSATSCTAAATAKSATAKVDKYAVTVTDVQVQVDASDSSTLKVSAKFGLRGQANVNFPPPQFGKVFGLFWETELPPEQKKDYQGAVSKLETGFGPFSADATKVLAGSKKALDQWKKDRPDDFKGATSIDILINAQLADLTIKGSYICKKTGAGKFTNLLGDVPVDKTGSGGATISQ